MSLIKTAQAIVCNPVLEKNCVINGSKISANPQSTANSVISGAITIFIIIGVIYFFLHFIFAGYKFMTSQGDAKKIEEAKHSLTNSLIGIFVVLIVFAITRLILTLFGINSTNANPLQGIPWPTL